MLTHQAARAPERGSPDRRLPAATAARPLPESLPVPWPPVLRVLLLCALALLARLTVFIRQRSAAQYDTIDVAAALQIALVAATLGLMLFVLTPLRQLWVRLAGSSGRHWFYLYGLGLLSAAWSIHPAFSLFRALEVLSQSVVIMLVIAHVRPFRRAEHWALGLAWIALLFDFAGVYRFTAGFRGGMESNSCSAIAALLCGYSVMEWWGARGGRRRGLGLGAAAAFVLLILSGSLASWWALLFGVVLTAPAFRRGALLLLPAVLVLLSALWMGSDLIEALLLRNKPVEQLGTLHGRTYLWGFFLEAYWERPLLGHGFAIGARTLGGVYTTNTHNSVLSVMLGGGALTLLVALGMVARYLAELWRGRRASAPGAAGSAAVALIAFVNSLSLAFLGEAWMPATFAFVCFFALHVLHVRPAIRATRHGIP